MRSHVASIVGSKPDLCQDSFVQEGNWKPPGEKTAFFDLSRSSFLGFRHAWIGISDTAIIVLIANQCISEFDSAFFFKF